MTVDTSVTLQLNSDDTLEDLLKTHELHHFSIYSSPYMHLTYVNIRYSGNLSNIEKDNPPFQDGALPTETVDDPLTFQFSSKIHNGNNYTCTIH